MAKAISAGAAKAATGSAVLVMAGSPLDENPQVALSQFHAMHGSHSRSVCSATSAAVVANNSHANERRSSADSAQSQPAAGTIASSMPNSCRLRAATHPATNHARMTRIVAHASSDNQGERAHGGEWHVEAGVGTAGRRDRRKRDQPCCDHAAIEQRARQQRRGNEDGRQAEDAKPAIRLESCAAHEAGQPREIGVGRSAKVGEPGWKNRYPMGLDALDRKPGDLLVRPIAWAVDESSRRSSPPQR